MKSYKFRIYPSKIQDKEMQKHLGISKELWSKLLELFHQLVNALEELASQDMAEQNYGKQIGDAGWECLQICCATRLKNSYL